MKKAGIQLLMKLGRIAMGRQRIMQKNYGRSHTRSSTLFTLRIQSPKGKRIINLLGSKGNKAVALAF